MKIGVSDPNWQKWLSDFPQPFPTAYSDPRRYRRLVEAAVDASHPAIADLTFDERANVRRFLGGHADRLAQPADVRSTGLKAAGAILAAAGIAALIWPSITPFLAIMGTAVAALDYGRTSFAEAGLASAEAVIEKLVIIGTKLE